MIWRLIIDRWRAHQRSIDLDILWPICKREAAAKWGDTLVGLDWAKAAFAIHAFNDPAWQALGHEEIIASIEALE